MTLDLSKILRREWRGKSTPHQRSEIDRLRAKDPRIKFTYQDFLANLSERFGRLIKDTTNLKKEEAIKVLEDMKARGAEGWAMKDRGERERLKNGKS